MTVFSDTFDKNTPPGGGDPSEADDRMREIKAATQERENVDHYWPLTGTEVSDEDAGEHRKVTLRVDSAPAAVADKGFVYAKDVSGKAELFYRDEDGDEIQITSGGILNSLNLTGVQAVAGIKTFSAIPKIPTAAPTVDAQVAGKKYVDDQLVSAVSIVKAWAYVRGSNGEDLASYNVSSISRTGTGLYTVNWNTDFASENYATAIGVNSAVRAFVPTIATKSTGNITVRVRDAENKVLVDANFSVVAFGTQ